jgi:hypothetical protein
MILRFIYPLVAGAALALGQTSPRFLEQDAWIAGYAVHYEYCFHADNLVSFRLCPESSCEAGCRKGGEYLVDIEFFTSTFLTAQSNMKAAACESILANCQQDEDNDENQCYINAQAYYCIDDDGINDGQDFQIENYSSCQQIGNNLYAGPYCGPDNHHIYLGTFTDAACSVFAEDGVFEAVFGYSLPYGWYTQQSVVGDGCISCHSLNDNGADGGGGVLEQCTNLYQSATGKCEANLKVEDANVDACDNIKQMKKEEGIWASRKGGRIIAAVLLVLAAALAGILLGGMWYRKIKTVTAPNENYVAQDDS